MSHTSKAYSVQGDVSGHIALTHLNSPTIAESRSGIICSVLRLRGVSFETVEEATLNQYHHIWHQALCSLDENFSVYVTLHRRRHHVQLQHQFKQPFLQAINDKYHASLEQNCLYLNDLYLTIMHKGVTTGKAATGMRLYWQLNARLVKQSRQYQREQQIKALQDASARLKSMLSCYSPQLLGEQDQATGYSELLAFLSLVPNAGGAFAYPSPATWQCADSSLYPASALSRSLVRKQLFFGRCIQFQGASESEVSYGVMLSIKQYSTATASIILNPLLKLPCELISTHGFMIESREVGLARIKKHMIKMENVNDAAKSQINALHRVRDQIAGGQLKVGYHHNTVMLMAATESELEQAINKAVKIYAEAGIVLVRETIGQEAAFWSQIPANLNYIARKSLITSENFVDMASLHNYQSGYYDRNHLGKAVTIVETLSKTPFFFNFHVSGSKKNPSKGHTIIIGGNGSGKTALMCFLDAQLSRYHGDSYFFDRDRGAELYLRAAGGHYAILSPDHPESCQFNPFQIPDTPGNRQFVRDWLCVLCQSSEETVLDSAVVALLQRVVNYAFDYLDISCRQLRHATKILPVDFPCWAAMRRWLRGEGHVADGEYAYLFDNAKDALSLTCKMGFDLTHFLDREPTHVRTAVMMYLCHRVEMNLTGRLTAMYFDEGWQNLIDPYWKRKFRRWLPTLRKKNAFIVMSTQSPSSVLQSPIRGMMLDNVATQIFFSNPQARAEEYQQGFRLSSAEFDVIANNDPKSRMFLYKQEQDSVICQINLSMLADELLILSASTESVLLCDQVRQRYGDDPASWLPVFLSEWSKRL